MIMCTQIQTIDFIRWQLRKNIPAKKKEIEKKFAKKKKSMSIRHKWKKKQQIHKLWVR